MTATGVAILVDGENISHQHAPRILDMAAGIGAIRVARVYGHVPQINGWAATAGFVAVHTARAKDGADLVLAIEAVALSHTPGLTHLVIVTSDSGLAPLLHHLRAAGCHLTLMGEAKTPEGLRLAASQFIVLGQGVPALPSPPPSNTMAPAGAPRGLDDMIRRLIVTGPDGTSSISLQVLAAKLGSAGYQIKSMGSASWRAYLAGRTDLCRLEGDRAQTRVILTRNAHCPAYTGLTSS